MLPNFMQIKVSTFCEVNNSIEFFKNIARLIEQYQQAGHPYFSVDTKAKEFRGKLFRKGRGPVVVSRLKRWIMTSPVGLTV